jgi:glycine/D-amino acid oxidase-like deaminating enzyme
VTGTRRDVVIVGGAIVGSAAAYFLKRLDPACNIAVIEPDST